MYSVCGILSTEEIIVNYAEEAQGVRRDVEIHSD